MNLLGEAAWLRAWPAANAEVRMRRVRCRVAMSFDGYIAGPADESDWILMDPAIDFAALGAWFDTLAMGRHVRTDVAARPRFVDARHSHVRVFDDFVSGGAQAGDGSTRHLEGG